MDREVTHHMESLISCTEDMFHVQSRGREIDREMWFLARDHAKAASGELQLVRGHVEAQDESIRELEAEIKRLEYILGRMRDSGRMAAEYDWRDGEA